MLINLKLQTIANSFLLNIAEHEIFSANKYIQYNLNSSNPDGSFTVDDSNSFVSPYKILQIVQENKYLGIFSYFIMELYVVCSH